MRQLSDKAMCWLATLAIAVAGGCRDGADWAGPRQADVRNASYQRQADLIKADMIKADLVEAYITFLTEQPALARIYVQVAISNGSVDTAAAAICTQVFVVI